MSPVVAALSIVCRDIGAGAHEGFLEITLLGLAALIAALPPDLTMAEFADAMAEAFGSEA